MSEIRDDLWLYSPSGILVLPGVPVTEFSWAIEENKFGVLKATGPLSEIDLSLFQEDCRFEIHRFLDGSPLGVEGDTQFLLRYWTFGETDRSATWEIEAYTPEYILTGRIVDSWATTEKNPNALTGKSGAADNVLKALVDENLGPSTPSTAARRVAELAVEANLSLAPTVSKDCAYENLMSVMAAVSDDSYAAGTWLSFGLVKSAVGGTGFTFRVWKDQRGTDHTRGTQDEVVVSSANRNLKNPRVTFDHRAEWTAVRALGKGEGKSRMTARVEDTARSTASPLAYREVKIESSQATTTAALTAIANAELQKGRPRVGFEGLFVDGDSARYGSRVKFGDLVTAEYLGLSFTCRLARVEGRYSRDGAEELTITLKGEMT